MMNSLFCPLALAALLCAFAQPSLAREPLLAGGDYSVLPLTEAWRKHTAPVGKVIEFPQGDFQ